MKRKRGSGRRKPKKPPVEVAKNASANSAFLIAEDYSDGGDYGNDGFDPTMEAETTHANVTPRSHLQGLDEPAFVGETNGGNSIHNGNLLKSVASFAAKLSSAVVSSNAEPSDNSLPLQGEKMQGKKPRMLHQDPQYNEQELNAALVVIKKIMKTDATKPFNAPVDPAALGIPDYFDVVDTPMDFGTICNNLELGLKYRDSVDVYKDVQLIWDNCSKYNKKGDYILELMKQVKSNFIKHWNAAGLFRQQEEVDNVHLETNLQDAAVCFTRHNKDGHVFPAGSMISNSIHQDRPDLVSLCQVQRQEYSPCFSHTHSQHISSQCQCQWQPLEFQSFQPHYSRHLVTAGTHMCPGDPIHEKHYSQRPDKIRPHQEFPHHSSPGCGTQCHPRERPHKYQSSYSHLQSSTLPADRGHGHLPIHGVSSSSTCNKCEHACTSVSMSYNANHYKHYHMCSCLIHEHQSLLRCCEQYQPHKNTCQYHSNSSKMQNTEPDVRDAGNAGHSHMHSPVESTFKHTKRRLRYPMGPVTDGSSHQHQCQMGLSQVPMMHGHSYQPQGKSCQCQLDLGRPEAPLPQDRPNIGGTEHSHMLPHAESTVRQETEYSGTPCPDDCSDEQKFQIGPSESQSPSMGLSDQPKEDGPQYQRSSSPPEPSLTQGGANMTNADSTGLERKTRGRGPTRCLKLLAEGKPMSVTTNEQGQPVGPEASKLVSFLGTLARNGHLAPLTYVDWRAVPEENKENMWVEVQTRFEIDPNSKSWVIKSLGKKWKDWKSKLKTAHYIPHTSNEERLADRDERVLPEQWAYLVSHWSSEEAEKRSATNKANRAQQKFGHITGTKSFARIREEQRVKRPDGKAPSRAELFILTRTRKDGKPVNEASSTVITQLRELGSQQQDASQNSTARGDIFSQVVGRDRHGCVRCYGLGPSPDDFGAKPTQAEVMKTVSEANDEVRQMKERLVAMEHTCGQMAQQMATMMSMMSSMQNNSPVDKVPDVVRNASGTS